MNCEYWKEIVDKLETDSYWAAHVLATCIDDEDSNLSEALKCVDDEELIEKTIFAYDDWIAQPSCDKILLKFEKQKVGEIFNRIKDPTENMKNGVLGLLELYY